jgi:hypothetical protein
MRIVVLAESPADQAAIAIFAGAILNTSVECVDIRPRAGGFAAVLAAIRPTLLSLIYRRTADALIVAVDSNGSPIEEDCPGGRIATLRDIIDRTKSRVAPGEDVNRVRTALAVAAPSLEAWLRFGLDNQCSEAAWRERQQRGAVAADASRQLKRDLFGSDRIALHAEIEIMKREATRIVQDLQVLAAIEHSFPYGFKSFADSLRSW